VQHLPASHPLRVAVLLGGDSPEREISLASGTCVASALRSAGHRVETIDPAGVELPHVDWQQFDVAFIALHGGAGEDGRVQKTLDTLGVPYTGSGPAASALAMCKSAAKQRWVETGVPTPDFVLAHAVEPVGTLIDRAHELGYPLIVKPDNQGSSLGVSLVHNVDQLVHAVADCRHYDPCTLAERYVAGREFTVALLGSRPLPLIEVVTGGTVFDYDAKYHHDGSPTKLCLDTGLSDEQIDLIEQTAAAAAESLGTDGLVRVDLMIASDGRPFVLELNTSPGMTDQSLVPLAAAHAGLSMPELCDYLVRTQRAAEMAA